MPECQHCLQSWSWWHVTKRSFTIRTYMICPHCRVEQYPSARSRRRASGSSFLFILLIMSIFFFIDSWILMLVLFFSTFFIQVAVYPLYLTLANEEEAVF